MLPSHEPTKITPSETEGEAAITSPVGNSQAFEKLAEATLPVVSVDSLRLAAVHETTEAWVVEHRDAPLSAVVALGQAARAETLALVAELSDAQLAEKLPGAPWADGTIGAVLAVNADHGRMHWRWVKDGFAAQAPVGGEGAG